jgi:hypothetical protein
MGGPAGKPLSQILPIAYPNFEWDFQDQKSLSGFSKKSQNLLKTALKKIFPDTGNVLPILILIFS